MAMAEVTKRQSQVQEQVDIHDQRLDELMNVVDILENRIHPILTGAPPTADIAKDRPELVPLADKLSRQTEALANIIQRLYYINGRIEL